MEIGNREIRFRNRHIANSKRRVKDKMMVNLAIINNINYLVDYFNKVMRILIKHEANGCID